MRNVFVVADLLDRVDDVVGKLLRRVVCGRVKRRFRSVVVDSHAAADVEQIDRDLHLVDLRVNARRFLHRILDALDIGELRADMEVEQLQHVHAIGFFETPDHFQ